MLLVVGGRPKTAGLTVLRLMLVDRSTLCRRHDMRVPTGSHFVIELRVRPWGGGSPLHLVCSWLSVVGNGW